MAKNVTATQLGAQPKTFTEEISLAEIMEKFDCKSASIKVNGQTVDENYTLKDYDFVTFGEKVKGGAQA